MNLIKPIEQHDLIRHRLEPFPLLVRLGHNLHRLLIAKVLSRIVPLARDRLAPAAGAFFVLERDLFLL